jgi:hypothetical protein
MQLREAVGRAIRATWGEKTPWETLADNRRQPWLEMADSALAAVEHERKQRRWWK